MAGVLDSKLTDLGLISAMITALFNLGRHFALTVPQASSAIDYSQPSIFSYSFFDC